MNSFLYIAQIVVAVALIGIVLLQVRGGGLGGIFGQADTVYRTKRGVVKRLKFVVPEATPIGLLQYLAVSVIDLNLQTGIENSLDAKLSAALNAIDDLNQNNDVAAINSIGAFINAVETQRGNKILEADADVLITLAQRIIDLLLAE